ncbi:hypothetical protein EAI_08616 [Harpegnathos saltator]|uniref:Reverse transcriptase domain-containing protein n=1 Tax=Harpegnathos saltator TaxID=610380 RepID=E2B4I8_HARSA|nr:hypothetical protein EAI_08616 [Harpegnathos saltator]
MDRITDAVKNSKWIQDGGIYDIKILCYADDVILIAETEDDLLRFLQAFNTKAQEYNMLLFKTKIKRYKITSHRNLKDAKRNIYTTAVISGHRKNI